MMCEKRRFSRRGGLKFGLLTRRVNKGVNGVKAFSNKGFRELIDRSIIDRVNKKLSTKNPFYQMLHNAGFLCSSAVYRGFNRTFVCQPVNSII